MNEPPTERPPEPGAADPGHRDPAAPPDRVWAPDLEAPDEMPDRVPPLRDAVRADGAAAAVRQNRLAAVGMVVLLVALAFGGGFAMGRATAPGGGSALVPSTTPAPSASATGSDAGLPSDGPRLGSADAAVTIEYWADFQCPFCARFARDDIPQLTSRIAAGTVALVHRDFAFLGQESVDAAVAVRCAGRQDRYWPMHDAVYAAQQGENQGAFARPRLEQIADSVGVDLPTFTSCLDERAPLVDVLSDTAAGVRAGIQSTPTIDVNGTRFLGVPDVTRLLAAIDDAAAGATPGTLPTPAPTTDPWSGISTSGREAGDPAAPVTVELWMDYQAPASADVAGVLEPQLQERIVSGAVRVVQRDLATLGDESLVAATAVRCIAQQGGPAWFANDVLASSAQGAGSGVFTVGNVLRFAARLGLDVPALSTCLDDPSVAEAVRSETETGTALGLTSAPAVIVKVGEREVARFTGTLDTSAILAAIDAAGSPG